MHGPHHPTPEPPPRGQARFSPPHRGGISMATGRKGLTAADFPVEVPVGSAGYTVKFEMKDYDVLHDERLAFTEACFDLGFTGPLPGKHCSALLVVRPGDLLLPDEEEIGTFYRHLDPKTSSKLHEEEAAKFLSFFGEVAKAELNREGREWTHKAPSAEIVAERLSSVAGPIRDKFPYILRQEAAGTVLLSVSAFVWSLGHLDDVHRSYDPLIVENPKLVGVKALRLELLHYVERAALNKREETTVGRGVGTGIALGGEAQEARGGSYSGKHGPTDGGEEEHEEEHEEGGSEQDGGSDEEEEDDKGEDEDVMVTGEAEAVQFAGEKAVERENKKLREEKLVAEKRLDAQLVRMDTLFSCVSTAVEKLSSVADRMTSLEQTLGRSIQLAETAMRVVVQEAISNRSSLVEHMNKRWLPTIQALHVTAAALKGRRREDDELSLRGVADVVGERIKSVVSAEVKAVMESAAPGIAAAVVHSLPPSPASTSADGMSAKIVQELKDDVVKSVTSATQQGSGAAGFSLLPNALALAQSTPEIPPTPSNQQGAEAGHVTAATAGPGSATEEMAMWREEDEAGGVDPDILASIVMPDPEIEDPTATGAKSPPATTGEVGDGKQKRKGKSKADSSKGTTKTDTQGRKGSGVRVDKETRLAVSEMKFGKKSRYICGSIDKTEAAYCIAVAVSSFDGYVSDVILDEFDGVKEDVMKQYRSDWEVARLMPGGMWTVMWSRGVTVFRDRFQDGVNGYNNITKDGRAALTVALGPAVWFGELPELTDVQKAAKNKMASDMITRAAMCAAFAPVAAKVSPIPGVNPERLSEILAGTACAVWCFSETNATAEAAAGEGGAATTVRGASSEFARRCKSIIEVVLQRAPSHQVGEEEVTDMVMKAMKEDVLRSLPPKGDGEDHEEVIARVMIENLAFWGDCSVGGPKLKARGVVLPIDAEMKTIIQDRGARGQHKGKPATGA
ncbi:unnamed protein product [Closterium sp. Yama58-4]|nr:unnamed protein product [Closterium sp. Yama58-4]